MIEHGDDVWVLEYCLLTNCEGMNKEQLQNTNCQLILYFCIFTLRVWAKTKTVVVCIIINIASCNSNVVSLTLLSSPSNIEATNLNYFPLIVVLLCMRNKTHYTMSSYTNFEQYNTSDVSASNTNLPEKDSTWHNCLKYGLPNTSNFPLHNFFFNHLLLIRCILSLSQARLLRSLVLKQVVLGSIPSGDQIFLILYC